MIAAPAANASLGTGPAGATAGSALDTPIVTCGLDSGRMTKYLLGRALIIGADVVTATPRFPTDEHGSMGWTVDLSLHPAATRRWTDLTRTMYEQAQTRGNGAVASVGFLMDTTVLVAPSIDGPLTGNPLIVTGSLTKASATALAGLIQDGPLPVVLSIE